MSIDWTPEQADALRLIDEWLDDQDRPQIFRLFGYAGTGKSTLMQEIKRRLKARRLYARFATPTWRAAQVLRDKGIRDAGTIHGLIYIPKEQLVKEAKELHKEIEALAKQHKPRDREKEERLAVIRKQLENPQFILRDFLGDPRHPDNDTTGEFANWRANNPHEDLDPPADIIVVDECSMVSMKVGRDLASFGTPILAIGDPGQLPPIESPGFFTEEEPDVFLDEIHRQAKGNPILDMATIVRRDGANALPFGKRYIHLGNGVSREFFLEHMVGADAVLVGFNATRHSFNRQIRETLQFCLTVHKAQGSEWPKVTVIDNWLGPWAKPTRNKWLYTAITRAQTDLMIAWTSKRV
jgi:exodeoxyribonuclease V